MLRTSLNPTVAALITVVLWSCAFPAISVGVRDVEPIALAAVRFATAGAVMLGWLAWKRPPLPAPRDWPRILLCGAIGIALYNVLLNTGQTTVSAGAASFIIATQTAFAAALGALFLNERFGGRAWIGAAVSLAGIAVIAVDQPGDLRLGSRTVLVLGAAFCSAAYFTLQKPLVARYGPWTCAAYTILVGAGLLSPWLGMGLVQTAASAPATVAAIYLGLGAGVLAYASWMVALAGLGAARATTYLFLTAPLATLFAIPLTGVWPSPAMLIGGLVTLVGVAVVNAQPRRRSNPSCLSPTNSPPSAPCGSD